jgi:hypothetical protein
MILVPILPPDTVYRLAQEEYRRRREKGDSKKPADHRITNYIRHQLTPYDAEIRGAESERALEIRRAVYSQIAALYPATRKYALKRLAFYERLYQTVKEKENQQAKDSPPALILA